VGIVQQLADADAVLSTAIERARSLTHLARNRAVFQAQKERIYGESAALNDQHGPAHMLRHPTRFGVGGGLGH